MIYEVLKREKPCFQSKIQRYYIKKIKLFISTVPIKTVTPLLLDVGNGRVFGSKTEVEVQLYDRPEFLSEIECLASQFTLASYPWLSGKKIMTLRQQGPRDIKVTKNLEEGIKDADYLIIFPRLNDVDADIETVIVEQFNFLSTMAVGMDKYSKLTSKAVVVGKHESLFCHMMSVFLKDIPWNQLTGLTRHVASGATLLLSEYLKIPPRQFSGVTVFGENVVDVNMASVNTEEEMIQVVGLEDLKAADNCSYELSSFKKGPIKTPFENEEEQIRHFEEALKKGHDCEKCSSLKEYLETARMSIVSQMEEKFERKKTFTPEITPEIALKDHLQSLFVVEDLGEEEPFDYLNKYDSSDIDPNKPKEIYKLGHHQNEFYKESSYITTKNPLCPDIKKMAEQRRKDRLKENYFYEDSHLKNQVLVSAVIEDLKWLYDTLPKNCEKMFPSEGAATAKSLSEHLRLLNSGTDAPFSLMTCSMGAFGFPKEMFLSGPAKIDPKTKDIIFWQKYKMNEKVRIILMKQIMKIKNEYDTFRTYFENVNIRPEITREIRKVLKEYTPLEHKKVKKPKKSLSEDTVGMPVTYEGLG